MMGGCDAPRIVSRRSRAERWLPIPERVAARLGQLVYYAAWLDGVLGEAVVLGNPHATEKSDSTSGSTSSGKALVQAVQSIQIDHPFIGDFADRPDAYARYSYGDLEQILREYQALGKIADRPVTDFMNAPQTTSTGNAPRIARTARCR